MNYKSSFSKKTNKRIIEILIMIVIVMCFLSLRPDALMKDKTDQVHLSASSSDAVKTFAVEQVVISETGSIEENNLKLILNAPSNEVLKVTMTTPSGEEITKETSFTKSDIAPESEELSQQPSEQVEDENSTAQLGASNEVVASNLKKEYDASTDTSLENQEKQDSNFSETATLGKSDSLKGSLFGFGVEFSASEYGIYVFELYGTDGTNEIALDRISYIVKSVLSDDALSITLTEDAPLFYLQDKQNVFVRYVPQLVGNKEILTIAVPPMYSIARAPISAPGYVVSPIQKMPLPEDLYDDAMSDILKTFPQFTEVEYFTITFDGSANQGISFSFDTNYPINDTNTKNMGQIMLAYGADVEKIPMRIGGYGKSADGTVLVDKEMLNGVAIIKNAQDLFFPQANQNVGLSLSYPGDSITDGQSREPIRVNRMHYPMTGVRLYYAYNPEQLTPKPGFDGEQVVIDGITYWKVTLKDSEMGAFHNINGEQRYYFAYSNFNFPPSMSVKEGDIFTFGPTLVDYTHKGIEYKQLNAGNTVPAVSKAYVNMSGFSFMFLGTPGNWGGGELDRELEQGTSGEKFRFYFDNRSGYSNNPLYVYEEAKVGFDFPEGVYPTSVYLPNLRKSTIKSIEYYLEDNPDVPVYEYPTENSGTHTFNISENDHITKFSVNYDAIYNATNGTYVVSATIGTHKSDGTLMEPVENVEMTTTIKTKNDVKTMGVESADPVYKPFTYATVQKFKLVRYEKEDSLRFGSISGSSSNTWNLYDNNGPEKKNNLGAGFKKYSLLMKDYEDVVVEVLPYQGDGKMLSFVSGYSMDGIAEGVHVEKREIYYKSNLKSSWTLAETVSGNVYSFDLDFAGGEYVTGVKMEFGTLYGEALVAHVTSSSSVDGDGYGVLNGTVNHMMRPIMIQNRRAYYENSPEEEPLPLNNVSHRLEYKMTTSSEAQHINSIGTPHPTLNSDKARTTGVLQTFARQGFSFNNATVRVDQPSQFQGGLFNVSLNIAGGKIGRNPSLEYYARVYIEVHPDFSIVDIPNATLVDVIKASDTGNEVYIYDAYLGKDNNTFGRTVRMFLHPDAAAPVSGVKPFVRAGISEDAFLTSYMSTDDYFYEAPYTIYTPSGTALYPEWDIQSDLFWKLNFSYQNTVNTQVSSQASVQLHPVVDGKIQEDSAVFRDHEKKKLGIYGSMGNNSGGVIPHYEAKFEIPKKDRKTRSPNPDNPIVPLELDNKYDMYITGPIEIDPNLVNLNIQYLKQDGTPVMITAGTNQDVLESVYDIVIRFDEMEDRHNEIVVIPIATDFSKVGDDFETYTSFAGAEARYAPAPGAWGTYGLSHALKYEFESYSTDIRIGQDVQEIGRYHTPITDGTIVKVQSYYEENGVEKELETLSVGGTLRFNRDATHLTATVLKPDMFYITPANHIADENNDSDFLVTSPVGTPKINGRVELDWNDLEKKVMNKYDLALYALPTVTVVDSLNVPAHTTVNVTPNIKRAYDNGNIPNPPVNNYLRVVSDNVDPTVATVVSNPNTRKIDITAHKTGETTYVFTITNRFGEEFTVSQPIKVNVVPNYVQTAKITKMFDTDTNSKNLDNDKFDFTLWSSNDIDDDSEKYSVVGVDETTSKSIAKLQRGELNFIKEVPKVGYTSLGFTVTERGNAIDVTHVKNGIYVFELPVNANTVVITAINENSNTTLTLKKDMDPATIAFNPNQEFIITLTEKGETTPVVTATLKGGDSQQVPGIIFGRTYEVRETPVADYFLEKITIQKAGTAVGTQPVKQDPTDDNSYEFELQAVQDEATILVKNQLSRGKGIHLSKNVILDSGLAAENFTFELKGPNSQVYYGIIPTSTTTFPAAVKWYETANHTGTESDISELKIGAYTLTEMPNVNYELNDFTVASGTTGAGSTDQKIVFEVTPTSELLEVTANNRAKNAGNVSITKIVDSNYLEDTMAFTLTHLSTGDKYISQEKVTSNNFVFSSWKQGGNIVASNELPYGTYTLSETVEGEHHAFKKFHSQTGVTVNPTGKIATFTLDSTSSSLEITAENEIFERGTISILKVPDLDYGVHKIGKVEDIVRRTNDATIQVESTLKVTNTWRLTVTSTSQTAGGVVLPYQLLKYSKDGAAFSSLTSPQIVLDENATQTGDIYEENWLSTEDRGIVAELQYMPNMSTGDYTSKLTWSLVVGP